MQRCLTISWRHHIQPTYIIYCYVYQDLLRDLKSELSGNFENVIVAVMDAKVLYDAKCLRGAMKVSMN